MVCVIPVSYTHLVHSLFLAGNQFYTCVRLEWKDCSSFSPPTTVVLLVFLVFEALLFAIFTIAMLTTQLQAIWNDETVRNIIFVHIRNIMLKYSAYMLFIHSQNWHFVSWNKIVYQNHNELLNHDYKFDLFILLTDLKITFSSIIRRSKKIKFFKNYVYFKTEY